MNPLFLFLLPIALVTAQDLRVGFYDSSCPQAESIVQAVVKKHFSTDPSIAAALLHMFFHDCFVRGCDASILINSTEKASSEKAKSEKDAGENLDVHGFEIIDEAKSNLEARCPSTVSCADIMALATRDAVALAGGLSYDVPTGRRDGLRSDINDVILPGPIDPLPEISKLFTSKGLTIDDMVTLLGAHSIGVAHCISFRYRLFNSRRTGKFFGPAMDSSLRIKLQNVCGRAPIPFGNKDPSAFLDQNTSMVIDNSIYSQILESRAVLQSDQGLALDSSTRAIVESLASDKDGFLKKFADALVKMGNIEVLVGREGEIRKNCGVFNTPS